jgi:hypothetical protein
MHAHLSPVPHGETAHDASPPGGPAPVAACLLRPLDGGPVRSLTLWPDEHSAQAELERTGAGRTYEVEDVHGTPSSAPVTAASVVEFDGPRSPEQVAADRRANRERVAPAALQVPGALGAVVLRGDDGTMVVVALGESVEALAASARAILSTPLLPDEDPALLPGPDRTADCLVDDRGLTALLPASAPAGQASLR